MKRLLIILPALILLSACSGTPSVADLVDDPVLLQEVALDCSKMKRSEMKESEKCNNVKAAAIQLQKEQMEEIQKQTKKMMKDMGLVK